MCEEVGIELAYLPRYSPDYNAIEESFSGLKAWMRRNRELMDSFIPFFKGYIHLAVMQSYNAQKAKEYFIFASIEVTEEDININYSELI
jgi:DDE superfamily endonuclease